MKSLQVDSQLHAASEKPGHAVRDIARDPEAAAEVLRGKTEEAAGTPHVGRRDESSQVVPLAKRKTFGRLVAFCTSKRRGQHEQRLRIR